MGILGQSHAVQVHKVMPVFLSFRPCIELGREVPYRVGGYVWVEVIEDVGVAKARGAAAVNNYR